MRRHLLAFPLAWAASCAPGADVTDPALEVPLPAAGLLARFGERGVTLAPDGDDGLTVRLVGWGRDALVAVPPAPATRAGTRVEYARDGLTEWWHTLPNGAEQGWTLTRRPEGAGELALRLDLGPLEALEATAERARAVDLTGRSWSIDRVKAWDAVARALPARLEQVGDDLVVRVDDAGAIYPVTVDPVYTTAAVVVSGTQDYELLGYDVANAGDVNGDGYDDVAFGAKAYDTGGRVDVHLGSAKGLSAAPAVSLDGNGGSFGMVVGDGADVNGDGYDDLLVGAEELDAVTIYLGSAAGLSATPDGRLQGPRDSAFGNDIASAGDVNGDGYDDVIIGAKRVNNTSSPWYEGEVYICHGSALGLSLATCTIIPSSGIIELGSSVDGAGDVNGDGYDDVVIGAWGTAFLLYGSPAGITEDGYVQLGDPEQGYYYGLDVSGGSDVNGDGYADVVVGDYGYGDNTGRVSIHLGSSAGLSAAAAQHLVGAVADGYFGVALDLDGDIDGDGYGDLVVGATYYASSKGGQAYVYHGSATGLVDAPIVLTEAAADSTFGNAVALAGDVDGDGRREVLVGATAWMGNGTRGSGYLYLGYRDDDRDGYPVEIDCDDLDPQIYPMEEVAGDGVDQDCDGVDLCYVDGDGDGFRTDETVVGGGLACDGAGEAPASTPAGDCDDAAAGTSPGAAEVPGDGIDQDCAGGELCYVDADGDGFRTDETVASADVDCGADGEAAATTPAGDCDDAAEGVNPGATEVAGDGIDQDCVGGDLPGDDPGNGGGNGDDDDEGKGCGCSQAGGASAGWLALGLAAVLLRRRRT